MIQIVGNFCANYTYLKEKKECNEMGSVQSWDDSTSHFTSFVLHNVRWTDANLYFHFVLFHAKTLQNGLK